MRLKKLVEMTPIRPEITSGRSVALVTNLVVTMNVSAAFPSNFKVSSTVTITGAKTSVVLLPVNRVVMVVLSRIT